uniref:Phospholipase A2 inhibitor and Ly6/PLAUR domain-containing protein-like n=1 Tax=Geotrypetes seraphini TaxID=260995 RepID=A0A6P8NJP8_GEOSA|nr:phospholipase A2 inhibitor and Ly6/PLAUR domain-containing protein-like [Geotrypetes seraphini]
MRAFLTSICIIFALTATGLCLICERCLNIHGGSCSGASVKCKEDEAVCVSRTENTTIENDSRLSMFKGCMKYDPNICDTILHGGNDRFQNMIYNKCCKEDNCNRESFTVPPLNLTENGLECPTCYTNSSYECSPNGIMKCTGKEEQCYYFSATIRRPGLPFGKHASRGCISTGCCEICLPLLKGMTYTEIKNFTCM